MSGLLNRALANAWDKLAALDAESQRLVLAEYDAAADEIVAGLRISADRQGNVGVAGLQQVIGRVNLALEGLRAAQQALVEQQVFKAAVIGAGAIDELRQLATNGEIVRESIARLPDAAAVADSVRQQIIHMPGDDGLTLSDRIWRNHRALRDELMPVIQRAIVQGEEARGAARDALVRAGSATAEQIQQIERAKAGMLGDQARAVLTGPQAQAYNNALRVMRSEIDQANIRSSREAIYAVEDVVGTRFLLSPAHPRFDICDLHASVNLYGLCVGVYPRGKSPLPAHPNTLSYEEAVFSWEVTDEDKAGRDDPIAWLKQRSQAEQLGVLQSKDKVAALKDGRLEIHEITVPWRALQSKHAAKIPDSPAGRERPMINDLQALEKATRTDDVYIRWSRGLALDEQRGASRDYVSGAVHEGLSARHIPADASLAEKLKAVREYAFLRLKDPEIRPWLYRATEVGKDSDGYSSIAKITSATTFSDSFIKALDQGLADAAVSIDAIRDAKERLPNVSGFGREIVEEKIVKEQKKLRNVIERSSLVADIVAGLD